MLAMMDGLAIHPRLDGTDVLAFAFDALHRL